MCGYIITKEKILSIIPTSKEKQLQEDFENHVRNISLVITSFREKDEK